MTEMKTCPIDGCDREHRSRLLMCNLHWRMVPKDLQTRVYKTARTMWNGEPNGVQDWEEAAQHAIIAVEEKEGARAATKEPIRGEDEPVDVLTALAQKFGEFLDEEGCRGFIMISKDDRGGVAQIGYGEDEDMRGLHDLQEHVEAFFKAQGVETTFIWPDNN